MHQASGSSPRSPNQTQPDRPARPHTPKLAAKGTQTTYTVFCTVEQQNLYKNAGGAPLFLTPLPLRVFHSGRREKWRAKHPPGRSLNLLLQITIRFCYIAGIPELLGAMNLHIRPDKSVPLPSSEEPEVALTLRENMQIAANTAALLNELRPAGEVTDDDASAADEVFKAFSERAKQQFEEAIKPDAPEGATPAKRGRGRPRKYPIAENTPVNPPQLYQGNVAERIRTMLNEYNSHTVADAAELRMVVTNKLLDLSMCGDPRIEIKAAEMLGKISDVGLFTEKTEITVNYNSVADIDKAIKDKVRKMLLAHGADLSPVDIDIDAELGIKPLVLEAEEPEQPDEPTPPATDESPEAPDAL